MKDNKVRYLVSKRVNKRETARTVSDSQALLVRLSKEYKDRFKYEKRGAFIFHDYPENTAMFKRLNEKWRIRCNKDKKYIEKKDFTKTLLMFEEVIKLFIDNLKDKAYLPVLLHHLDSTYGIKPSDFTDPLALLKYRTMEPTIESAGCRVITDNNTFKEEPSKIVAHMIPNDKSFAGGYALIQGENFLPDQIRLHMGILAFYLRRKKLPETHGESLIWDPYNNCLMSTGARAEGQEISKASEYYKKDLKYRVFKPRVPLTDDEILLQWDYYNTIKDSKYQVGNFAAWITYLKTWNPFTKKGIWLGKPGDALVYCFESVARFCRLVNRYYPGNKKKDVNVTSIYDLNDNPDFYEWKSN